MATMKQKDSKLIKIAVVMPTSPGKIPQFLEFYQNESLSSIIQLICTTWDLPDPENYILQSFDTKNQYYITESNKNYIKKGSILRLELSPAKNAQDIVTAINNECDVPAEQSATLAKLSYLSSDLTFAEEFFKLEGLTLVIKNIEQDIYKNNALKYALIAIIELMKHEIIKWDTFEKKFINKIACLVNKHPTTQDTKTIGFCLLILEKIVLHSTKNLHVEKKITIHNLIQSLQNTKQDCKYQQNVIALINAIFYKADLTRKTIIAAMISSKQCRSIIYENVISASECSKNTSKYPVDSELTHQLYILQTLMLGLLEPKMKQRADAQEQESQNKTKELRKIAFGSNSIIKVKKKRPGATFSKSECKHLGFDCEEDKVQDFNEVPPGVLALDCMLYFAKKYPKDYKNIVFTNSCIADEHECPLAKTSVELVKLLCDILHIGEPPSEQGQTYHLFLFNHEKPFEELFCICIVVFNKTWEEMRAKTEDIIKVLSVLREQIVKALASSPKDFDEFRETINQKPFVEITKLWQRVRNSCRRKMGNFI